MADRRPDSHPSATYVEAEEAAGAVVAALEGRIGRVETGRMVTFLVGAIAALLHDDLPVPPSLTWSVAGVALVGFVVLVVRHRRLAKVLRRARVRVSLARLGLARIAREWGEMTRLLEEVGYRDPMLEERPPIDEHHPYGWDLDVFGPMSVRSLLGPTPTPTGSRTLQSWLEAPAAPEVVRRRQAAVRGLALDTDDRATLATEGLLIDSVGRMSWQRFLTWLDRPPLFTDSNPGDSSGDAGARLPGWSRWVAWVMPPITLVCFGLWFGTVGWPGWTWFVPLSIQSVLAWRWGKRLEDYFGDAGAKSPGVRRHHALFAAWEAYRTDEPVVRALQERLGSGEDRASDEIRALERLLDLVASRASMFHIVFASVLFWDIHLAAGLERWRTRTARHVPGWFDALGELEALAALATLAHDQPDWCFPDFVEDPPRLVAEGLGHPLLSDEVRRSSDVAVDPPGRFLLVTGSNMSGKSTLLRSIGLAAVLGQAGSVVCARRASMTPLQTFTSMRIRDSLTDGVSHFMAEVLRLKALVDAVPADDRAPALLYLIDEVLQGTNSEERRVAARRIVRHLLAARAIGAVTTHDLSLHDDPYLDPTSTKVHFRETVSEDAERILSFDYVLRPGLATSRNALELLRIVGLSDEGHRKSLHSGPTLPDS